MYTQTMINPKTNRKNKFNCWDVEWSKVIEFLSSNNSDVKALSWSLLNDDESVQQMKDTLNGDRAESNFALHVFENALDWGIGIGIVNFMKLMRKLHKRPSVFTVAVNGKGDVMFAHNGKIIVH